MIDGDQDNSTQTQTSPSNDAATNTNTDVSHETKTDQSTTETEKSTDNKIAPNGYEGSDFVEFTPEQQKRINVLTKKLGKFERESGEYRQIAKQQFDLINELRSGQQQIVTHLQSTNYTEVESQLKAQKKAAWEKGDLETYESASEKLADIKIERKLQEKEAKRQPQPQQVQQRGVSGDEIVERAVNQGAISRSDADVYNAWATEVDDSGNLVRPWVNERDGRNTAASAEGKAVFSNPALQNKPFSEKLKEIDRRMGVQQRQANQSVMGSGNLTGNGKTSNVKMSPWAEDLAVKTQFAGKGKSRQDHIEAYRKQINETRSARR